METAPSPQPSLPHQDLLRVCATPVRRIKLGTGPTELYLKDDGLTHPLYGGNKIRKLAQLLPDALRRGKSSVLTAGAAGSHHVLATTVFAERLGLTTRAILFPQPYTPHAEENLRAALALGLDVRRAKSLSMVPWHLIRYRQPSDYFIPPGGSNRLGAHAYLLATMELKQQIEQGLLPEPDWIVVALGSGGTAAGLLAGLIHTNLRSNLLAVQVTGPRRIFRPWVTMLAARILESCGARIPYALLNARLHIDQRYIESGYGTETKATRLAQEVGNRLDIQLETTYTARAFAAVLELCSHPVTRDLNWPAGRATSSAEMLTTKTPVRVLYWHTLSRDKPDLLELGVRAVPPLPEQLRPLFAP